MPPELKFSRILTKAAKEKLEIVLSTPVQGEAGGRGVWGEFRPPTCPPKFQRKRGPVSSVRIFSNRHRNDLQEHSGRVFAQGISAKGVMVADPIFHRGYMSAIENGKKNITIQQLERLAQALRVSVDKLLK